MDNSRSIQLILVLIVAMFLAIWLGLSIVTHQAETILQVVGVTILVTCLFLGRRIWLLIPFMAALNIGLRVPGQPSTLFLGQALVIGFSGLLLLMRKLPIKLSWTELELWILVLTVFIFQVYVRNPVGLNIFGGGTVGGKGYVLYAMALASTILLCGMRVPANELKWIVRISIIGGMMNAAVSIIGKFVPVVGYYTGGAYESNDSSEFDDEVVDEMAASRVNFLLDVGNNLALWISSYISPLRACIKPLWALLVLGAVAAAAMSGFRNAIASVGMTFLVGIAYRSGFAGLAISIMGAVGGLALLAVVNTLHPLPPNIQRSLTFLPGTWEERYRLDAEGSSEWRFEIWREVLLTDRWINNKWLGDGLGFTAVELEAQKNARIGARAGVSGFEAHRDTVLSNGDYHSGPISTVRVIGYTGLLFFLLAQIRLAVHAHRQILRCRGTEWYPLSLFIGIPQICGPIFFIAIFGDFKTASAVFLLAVGMMRLLENNLPLTPYAKQGRMRYQQQVGVTPSGGERRLGNRLGA